MDGLTLPTVLSLAAFMGIATLMVTARASIWSVLQGLKVLR